MSSLPIDDNLRKALESNARRRGLSLPDYLRLVADTDDVAPSDEQHQADLRQRLLARINAAEQVEPDPLTSPAVTGRAADFAAAVIKKFRPASAS